MENTKLQYPYNSIKSLEVFPETERPNFDIIDAIALRYDNALQIAEQQIEDLLREYPFIPEDLNFETLTIDNIPQPHSYINHSHTVLIKDNTQPMTYHLKILNKESITLFLPNSKAALAVFNAIKLFD